MDNGCTRSQAENPYRRDEWPYKSLLCVTISAASQSSFSYLAALLHIISWNESHQSKSLISHGIDLLLEGDSNFLVVIHSLYSIICASLNREWWGKPWLVSIVASTDPVDLFSFCSYMQHDLYYINTSLYNTIDVAKDVSLPYHRSPL